MKERRKKVRKKERFKKKKTRKKEGEKAVDINKKASTNCGFGRP